MKKNPALYVFFICIFLSACSKSTSNPENIVSSYNDIYLAGSEENASGISVAKYWKNTTEISLTDGTNYAEALDIFVTDTDIYVAGSEENSSGVENAKYWKNGIVVNLTNGVRRSVAYDPGKWNRCLCSRSGKECSRS